MESLTIYTQQIHYEGTIAPLAACPSCPSLDSSQCVNRKDKRVLQGMIAREKKQTHEDSGKLHNGFTLTDLQERCVAHSESTSC